MTVEQSYKPSTVAPSAKAKNLIRGFLDKKINNDNPTVFPKLLNRIYRDVDQNSIRWAEAQLRYDPIFSHVDMPEDFPSDPDPIKGRVLGRMQTAETRLRSLIDRAATSKERVEAAAAHLRDINKAIFVGDTLRAASGIADYLDAYGYSHIILRKLLFLNSVKLPDDAKSHLSGALDKIDHQTRDVIRPSLADAYSVKRQYLGVAENILNISSSGPMSRIRQSISGYVVRPFAYDRSDFHDRLEAFSNYSLIDALYYASTHLEMDEAPQYLSSLRAIWEGCDCDIRAALRGDEVDPEAIVLLYDTADSGAEVGYNDVNIYRHLTAFIECTGVLKFRALSDFYLTFPPDDRKEPNYVSGLRRQRFGQNLSWRKLVEDSQDFRFELRSHSPETCGTLQRSLAMAVFFSHEDVPEDIAAADLVSLMDKTTFADKIISQEALVNLKQAGEAQGDLELRLIPLCLLAANPENSQYEFQFRRVSQDLVRRDFQSDFVALVRNFLERAYQVGTYLYMTSTDDFLMQLYHIHPNSSDAVECRARLHELMYEYEKDKVFLDRADSLRLTAKIVKARDELNDSRIYVDLTRFSTWLNERKISGVLELARPGVCQVSSLEQMTLKDVNASQSNEAQLLRELAECYKEFCENRIFGIASYLGRRIRHGTLKGTLLQDLDREIQDRFPPFKSDPQCRAYFEDWKSNFESYIKKIGADHFISSPLRSQGE